MKILHLDAGKQMGGGQHQVLRLIEGLLAENHDCTLLARAGYPLFEAAHKQGWRVEPLGLTRFASCARNHDLIHAHDARTHTLALLNRKTPLIVARRVAFPISSKFKYARPNHYIAVSNFVKNVLTEAGIPETKISVVYDGVPSACIGVHRRPIILTHPEKSGALAQEAARLANLELNVSTDLETDLPTATIFLYVSQSEGLGSGVLLAMSAGCAVVASKVGGIPEIVHHRHNGMLVENTPEAIAEALQELHENPALVHQLSQAAQATMAKRFTTAEMVRSTMEVYRRVLA